jgi:hypothetical protein
MTTKTTTMTDAGVAGAVVGATGTRTMTTMTIGAAGVGGAAAADVTTTTMTATTTSADRGSLAVRAAMWTPAAFSRPPRSS